MCVHASMHVSNFSVKGAIHSNGIMKTGSCVAQTRTNSVRLCNPFVQFVFVFDVIDETRNLLNEAYQHHIHENVFWLTDFIHHPNNGAPLKSFRPQINVKQSKNFMMIVKHIHLFMTAAFCVGHINLKHATVK